MQMYRLPGGVIYAKYLVLSLAIIHATTNLSAQRGGSLPRVNPVSSGGGGDGFMNGILIFFGAIISLVVGFYLLMMVWGMISWITGCLRKLSFPLSLLIIGAGAVAGWASWNFLGWRFGWSLLVAGAVVILTIVFLSNLPKYRYLKY